MIENKSHGGVLNGKANTGIILFCLFVVYTALLKLSVSGTYKWGMDSCVSPQSSASLSH
jgi:hypothetical protein